MSSTSQHGHNDSLILHCLNSVVYELLRSPCVCSVYTKSTMKNWFLMLSCFTLVLHRLDAVRSTGNVCHMYFINHLRAQTHTCHLSVIWTESPSFSSNRNLRPRRLKSPSFEHRRFSPQLSLLLVSPSFHHA